MSFGFAEKSYYQMPFGSNSTRPLFLPLPLFSLSDGNRYNMFNTEDGLSYCLELLYAKSFHRKGLSFYWVYVCALYRYLSCKKKMFCCLTALLLYFLFTSRRMQLCVCSYWRNFKMRRSAPIPLRANYMHITTAANS